MRIPPGPACGLSFIWLAAGWLAFAVRSDRTAVFFLLAAVAASGAARLALQDREYERNPLHSYKAGDYVDIAGRLYRSPGREPDRDVLFIAVRAIGTGDAELPIRGHLRLSVAFARGVRPRLDLLAGDEVRASVRLSSGGAFRNFGAFSYERYLRGVNIHRRASTKSSLLVKRTGTAPAGSVRARISRIRCGLQAELERRFPAPDGNDIAPEGAVLEALLLGEDGRLDEATIENLQQTGLYHLFAISGGHIAILNVLLFALFRLVRMSPRASRLALAAFLVFYTILVEGSPSVLRAVIMTLAYLAGKLLWKDVHVLNTISASALFLLLLNPSSLFDAGFQLTYVATLSIILFTPPLLKKLPRLPLKATELACLSVTAALGVTPLIAGSFNRVTLSSLLLNFAAIPLVGLIMGVGYAFLPFAAAFPAAAGPPAAVLRFLVTVFARISHALDPLPFLSFRVPTPRPWVVFGYFLFLGMSLVRPRFRGQRFLIGAGFSLFFFILVVSPFRPGSPELRVTMIDVGQGESLLVEFPGRRTMLVDGGGLAASSFDVGDKVVSPVLWRKGIKRIDYLVLTHPHPDHLDGLVAVAKNFRIGEFWEGWPGQIDGLYADFLRALPSRVIRRRCGQGFIRREGEVSIVVLHPERTAEVDPRAKPGAPVAVGNESSLVIKIALGRTAFLLTGDIGAATERELLGTGLDLRSTVLKAGHHGSAAATSAAFLAAVGPVAVLVSAGEGNSYGFPSPAVLERCRSAGAEVFRTDIDGAVEISADGRRLLVRRAAGPAADRDPDFRLTRTTKSMIIVVD
ncbi:MAG: DNA internalization-related competence protein ComEC/Rec2 [Candidatus Aminicenantes bacterium]|nr:DNA internalization-related competence protein ComEC/Rec2 [Candidatus Aminicenantes bacterium]